MKKGGILNAELIKEIASLGHYDSFVICDMGFPIPRGSHVIDLALIRGVPNVHQVLNAVLFETVIQEAVMVEQVKKANPSLDKDVRGLLRKQEINYCSFEMFRQKAAEAKFFIRTAEDAPCSNILLVSASGVIDRVLKYCIEPPLENAAGTVNADM